MDRRNKRGLAASNHSSDEPHRESTPPQTLLHPISPPTKKRRLSEQSEQQEVAGAEQPRSPSKTPSQTFRSPFQLTRIQDLQDEFNKDTITLNDLLGDPLISECWNFNYLHDIDFLMEGFDEDVRDLVNVHVVHGFWRRDSESKKSLEEKASRRKNVTLHAAYLPNMFGTHHTKMLILLRRDDTAQVIIHTANMIARDWTNLTQAVWSSPLLPLKQPPTHPPVSAPPATQQSLSSPPGSGARFKADLLNYLQAYGNRCRRIIDELARYDFSAVRGALVASVPGKHSVDAATTRWGWAGMQQALENVPLSEGESEVVVQVSSIATLGGTDAWFRRTFCRAIGGGGAAFKVVFPTADEIRRSLDGYQSGASIHTKTQSAQQAKQLEYLRPVFCHWANDAPEGKAELGGDMLVKEAGRKRAAPHIKTYVRYGNKSDRSIDWAMVTSANLSKQAWGEATNAYGEMHIASYEIGVLVWPALFAQDATMAATFLRDTAQEDSVEDSPVVALRLPYNLPLQPYGSHEVPWAATAKHTEPDWMGGLWVGHS
ncbi:tyrosyl-DNA phosphodiesterase I [Lasiosphaeris hirsuta]|uniref:Tyrosyl-DNA phosphodiesterase I n=1 Tax=Lasiosphaeris hirsuta TaxID=260670 RepID=A0AA40AFL1_9PEZI|nr:tyrosyl-DNA phosphodiesterase I [Lasiosphaeris hirsuta]